MAKLNEKYYIGVLAKPLEAKILDSLDAGTPFPGLYLVTVAANKLEQLDIVDAFSYFFRKEEEQRMEIVGLALGKKEALQVVTAIADDVYRKHFASDIREYFPQRP